MSVPDNSEMQIYFRPGMNDPLIYPWPQSDENACADQPAMHYFLLQVYFICRFLSLSRRGTRQGDETGSVNLRFRVRKHIFITKSPLETPINHYHPVVSKTHYCCSYLWTATRKSGLLSNSWLISCLSLINRRNWVCDLEQRRIPASPAPRLGETMLLLTWAFTSLEEVSVICLSI